MQKTETKLAQCLNKNTIIYPEYGTMMTGSKVKKSIVPAQKDFFIWDPQNTSMERSYAKCEC